MNIHEYQAKQLLKKYCIAVPDGNVATTPEEARTIAESLGPGKSVIKAQVHTGGRGKAGGVLVAATGEEAFQAAKKIIGMTLVTNQTGPAGKLVRKVWVERATAIARELYLAVVLDRTAQKLAVIASPQGGMDIEEVAASHPELIFTTHVSPGQQLWPFQTQKLLHGCGLDGAQVQAGTGIIANLVRLAWEKEATLVEINPLAVTNDGSLVALDAKINFDDSSLSRQPAIAALDDIDQTDALELEAKQNGLNYVRLNGNVGTMVNGAGLAMATMDIIKMAGAEPANFLDVGGGASEDAIAKGFEIILRDKNVGAILFNVFGGILRCDILASGIVAAAKRVKPKVPLIIRIEGTNVQEGRAILAKSGLDFTMAGSMKDAAEKIAKVASTL
ncbi:MAG: ADP-forming succinate--CoA ligase subunit beta [Nitrospirota bacterium]